MKVFDTGFSEWVLAFCQAALGLAVSWSTRRRGWPGKIARGGFVKISYVKIGYVRLSIF